MPQKKRWQDYSPGPQEASRGKRLNQAEKPRGTRDPQNGQKLRKNPKGTIQEGIPDQHQAQSATDPWSRSTYRAAACLGWANAIKQLGAVERQGADRMKTKGQGGGRTKKTVKDSLVPRLAKGPCQGKETPKDTNKVARRVRKATASPTWASKGCKGIERTNRLPRTTAQDGKHKDKGHIHVGRD